MGFKIIKDDSVKKSKRKKHFADYIIYISIFMIVGYTVAAIVLQYLDKLEISSTLTVSWYAFWTTEIISLATIKNTKTKNNKAGGVNPPSAHSDVNRGA